MAKSDNYGGGLPLDLFDVIAKDCVGSPLPGLTPDLRISLLNEMLLEEHAAANGGAGQTGIPEAIALFDKLRALVKALHEAPLAGVPAAATSVVTQLNKIGKQWVDVGPVHPAFYTFK